MEIDQEDFEEALGIAYRKGCARQQTICPCNEEIREVILDVYDLLKYDITASEPSVEDGRADFCDNPKECDFELGDEQCNVCSYYTPGL